MYLYKYLRRAAQAGRRRVRRRATPDSARPVARVAPPVVAIPVTSLPVAGRTSGGIGGVRTWTVSVGSPQTPLTGALLASPSNVATQRCMPGARARNCWEIAVPDGQYKVRLTAGGRVDAEGLAVVTAAPTAARPFAQGTRTITVSDGRLTLTADGGGNAQIADIEITQLAAKAHKRGK